MRLWHKDLIQVLPRQQLLSQWRECCAIAKSIAEKGTPNHIIVNKIMDYPIEHFIAYTTLVKQEMQKRGYKCDTSRFTKWLEWDAFKILKNEPIDYIGGYRYIQVNDLYYDSMFSISS